MATQVDTVQYLVIFVLVGAAAEGVAEAHHVPSGKRTEGIVLIIPPRVLLLDSYVISISQSQPRLDKPPPPARPASAPLVGVEPPAAVGVDDVQLPLLAVLHGVGVEDLVAVERQLAAHQLGAGVVLKGGEQER